jgi:ketosteroid isomerase-like protein
MSRVRKSIVVLVLTLLSAAPLTAQNTPRAQIDTVISHFVSTFNRGTGAGVSRFYASDAVLMPPNAAAVHGRPGIADAWGGMSKMGGTNLKLHTTELVAHGDMAHEMGTYSIDVKPKAGATAHDHGKYIVIWKRDPKAGWQLYRDIWNSDVPFPAAH